MTVMDPSNDAPPFDIAIIGAGIIGLHVALGLERRNIPVTVYEQASELKEIGAGLGFPSHIADCMDAIDSRISQSLSKVAAKTPNMRFIDASSQHDFRLQHEDRLFALNEANGQMVSCHRAELLSELVGLLPPDRIKLRKRLASISCKENNGRYLVEFSDGTSIEADAVIGCDGIASRVRQIVVSEDNPAAFPHYAKENVYRCLVDMPSAEAVMGPVAEAPTMYMGRGASLVAFPVANRRFLNFAGFVHDASDGPVGGSRSIVGSKKDVSKAFSEFGPNVRGLIDILPDELSCWALYDTMEHPLATYAKGGIVLVGDAAHASTPHFGAGAGMGVEDALVLATVLECAAGAINEPKHVEASKSKTLAAAFEAFDSIRRERSQWLVSNSRHQGRVAKWLDPDVGSDLNKFVKDTQSRYDKVVDFDWKDTVRQAKVEFERRL